MQVYGAHGIKAYGYADSFMMGILCFITVEYGRTNRGIKESTTKIHGKVCCGTGEDET
ncbi:hypothetical protein I4100191B2_17500 [Clostridiales bacterium]